MLGSSRTRTTAHRACATLLSSGLIGLAFVACSSSSNAGFVFDAGFAFHAEASSGTSTGSGVSSGTGTGTQTEPGTGTGSGTEIGTGTGSGTSPLPSSAVVITVIPDGTGIAQGLLTAIQNAKSAVHMEMYLLSNSTYISTLESLSSKIDVKVVLNETFPSGTATAQTNTDSYATLQGAGVNVHWAPANPDGTASGYTHEKAVIIDPGTDNAQVWIMTMNLDTDAPKDNREYLALDTQAADITEAESIFEADYAGTTASVTGNLVVSPVNSEQMLLALIESATTSIDMEAEEIDDTGEEEDLFNALTAKAKAGVTVRLVLEDSTVSSQTTAVTSLQQAGGKVVGYVYGTGLDIHAKALVADGARAYVGSENFTGGSLGYNRELGVIFDTATEVQKVDSTIATDFAGGSTYSSQ